MEDRTYPRFWIFLDFLIPTVILAVATVLLRIFPWDMQIERHFYLPGSGWILRDSILWGIFYHFGNLPALLLSLAAVFMLAYSYQKLGMIQYRKIALFLIMLMIIGPGLIVNVIFKDHWGRPRPREIVEFGGKSQYEKVLSIDKSSYGKSFPSGHAAMGFYLFAPFFVIRRKYPLLATLFLVLGISMGSIMGFARIVQGGHFASDIFWSGGLVYLTGAFIFYIMNLHHFLLYCPTEQKVPEKTQWMQVAVLFLALLLVLAVVFATPYEKEKAFVGKAEYIDICRKAQIQMSIPEADVSLHPGDWFNLNFDAQGFAVPSSAIKSQLWEFIKDTTYQATYIQKKKGIFTKLSQKMYITLPNNIPLEYWLTLEKGKLEMTVDSTVASHQWTILIKEGNCILHVKPGQLVHVYAETRGKKIHKQYGYTITPNPASKIPMIDMKIYLQDGDLFFMP